MKKKRKKMTLDQIIKIQAIIDKRSVRSDTLELLNEKRYSKSKECMIRYGDMHIDHFIRVFVNNIDDSQIKEYVKKVIVGVFKNGTH